MNDSLSKGSEILLAVPEAARRLAVTEKTVRKWIMLRKITFVKLGVEVRVPQSEIDRVIEEGKRYRFTDNALISA